MKANPDKCDLIINSSDEVNICVEKYNIKNSTCENSWTLKLTTN